MKTILVEAYAVSPYQGSEPAVGWNYLKELASRHDLIIITESKFKADCMDSTLWGKVEWHFVKRPRLRFLRKIWPPSYYWTLFIWHLRSYERAKQICRIKDVDLVHKLNLVGYRAPGLLWRIKKPFVWGPIGGLSNSPVHLLSWRDFYGLVFYNSRNIVNTIQRTIFRYHPILRRKYPFEIIAATRECQRLIKDCWGCESTHIQEVGISTLNLEPIAQKVEGNINVVWLGNIIPRKNLELMIDALKTSQSPNIILHVVGDGIYQARLMKYAAENNLMKQIKWYGRVERERALNIIEEADVFAITSISDLTSTVIIEAMQSYKPAIFLNYSGFTDIYNDSTGYVVQISTRSKTVLEFSEILKGLNNVDIHRKSLECFKIAPAFTYEQNGRKMQKVYEKVI